MDDKKMDADLGRSLGRIEGKVDMLLSALRESDKRAVQLEQRVRENEHWRSRVAGMATAVSALVASAVTFILKALAGV